jgi:hypothetical protein
MRRKVTELDHKTYSELVTERNGLLRRFHDHRDEMSISDARKLNELQVAIRAIDDACAHAKKVMKENQKP